MLNATYSKLSHAIQEKLTIVDAKVDDVLESTNRIERVAGRVDTNIVNVRGQVAHLIDGVSQIQSQGQKTQNGAHLSFSSPTVLLTDRQMACVYPSSIGSLT